MPKEKGLNVVVELSPAVYVALCGLVQDALQQPSDAMQLLKRAAQELAGAVASDNVALAEQSEEAEPFQRIASVG